MKSENEIAQQMKRQFGSSCKILTTNEHRILRQTGGSLSGYNIVFSGTISYNYERSITGNIICDDPYSAVHQGQLVRGVYKILEIDGENDTTSLYGEHGYHHSNQTFKCLYNRYTDADFLEDDVIEVLSYTLWQSVAVRNTNRLQVGDVFEVTSFSLLQEPYTCYQTEWKLISRASSKKTQPFSCATEGLYLPEKNGEFFVDTQKGLAYALEKIRQNINAAYNSEYPLIRKVVMENVAKQKPNTLDELLQVNGIGPYIVNHFGGMILSVIKYYKDTVAQIKIQNEYVGNKSSSIEEDLKQYRSQKANQLQIPSYCIFSNNVIEEIAFRQPKSIAELLSIKGIGEQKCSDYGRDILDIVAKYSKNSSVSGTKKQKGDSALISAEMYDEGYSAEEISVERGLKIATVYNHLLQTDRLDANDCITKGKYNQARNVYESLTENKTEALRELLSELEVAAFYYLIRQE